MPIVSVRFDDNAAAVAQRYRSAVPAISRAVAAAMDAENPFTVAHIQQTKLTAAGPRFLNVQSGRLRRSARTTRATISGNRISSEAGSNVAYAAAHEFGARAHLVTPRNGRALRFRPAGKYVFRRGKGFVFARSAKIPELPPRKPFETGVRERLDDYSRAFSAAIRAEFGL